MYIRVCDICNKEEKNIITYTLPSYSEISVTGGYHNTPTIELNGEIKAEEYDLCKKCAKQFFKDNVVFMLKKGVKRKNEEYNIFEMPTMFSVKYGDEKL